MVNDPDTVSFERPMPIEHRLVYGLFGCVAMFFAALLGQVQIAHLGQSSPQTEQTGWYFLGLLLLFGLPMIAAAVLGGAAEIILDRSARVLREVAWVGPFPAWRQTHPFAVVGKPLVIQSRRGKKPAFKIEIPVKDHAMVPLAHFATREQAETVAQAIQAAVASDGLPPFAQSAEDLMRARVAGVFLHGQRGPLE